MALVQPSSVSGENMSQKTAVGIPVDFPGRGLLYVHPMTRTIIRKYKEGFRKLEQGGFESNFDIFDFQADVIFDCLQINYPDLAAEEFDDLLNAQNQPIAWLALNSDFKGVDEAKKALSVLQSGNLIGTATPQT
jgi:hypothetical protein